MLAGPPYGVGAGALLDVEVVGVQREPEARPEQRPEGRQPLVDGVDQRGLVAVQRLDADHHARRGGLLDDRREVPAQLVVRRVPLVVGHPPGPPGRGVERPADPGGADRGGQVDARAQVVLGGRDGARVGGDQVASGRHRTDDVRREAGVADHRRGALGVEVAGLSSGSSTASKPRSATWRSRSGRFASVSGEVQTQVLMPMARTAAPSGEEGRCRRRPGDGVTSPGRPDRDGQGIWRSCQTSG